MIQVRCTNKEMWRNFEPNSTQPGQPKAHITDMVGLVVCETLLFPMAGGHLGKWTSFPFGIQYNRIHYVLHGQGYSLFVVRFIIISYYEPMQFWLRRPAITGVRSSTLLYTGIQFFIIISIDLGQPIHCPLP